MERPRADRKRRARKDVAAERLSTPDQLDQVIQVARFPSWLALAALILVALAGVVVSIYVPVPVKVEWTTEPCLMPQVVRSKLPPFCAGNSDREMPS